MIVNYWPAWFRQHYGGVWPQSYCCVDVETTGFSFTEDVVTEWGHCLVEDGKVVDRLSLVLDWTNRTTPPDHWLRNRLRQVKQNMEAAGKACHMSYQRMQSGMSPEKAFVFIQKFTDTIKGREIPFVLHNGSFDEKMLSGNYLQFGFGAGFSFGEHFLDTAGIEKASQIPDNSRMHPKKNESLRDYFTRVNYTRIAGVRSNLDEHCYKKYNFLTKYGITQQELHGASMDSYCCHLLMQEFGTLITEPVAPPITLNNDKDKATVAYAGVKRLRGQRRS